MNRKRAIVIIIDGVGIGEMPDASNYGDQGSHTLANLASAVGGLHLPNLEKMGLGKITSINGLNSSLKALANFGKMAEMSKGKDSTTGHWELAGLIVDRPFPTYPHGFPPEVINEFEKKINRGVLGNKPASGTEIIKELGEEHIKTGKPIVYTSADSVFQIAAHEEVIPLKELYNMCEIAREILTGKHAVARVIARPFIGNRANDFKRTKYRKDFSLKPFGRIMHQIFQDYNITTVAIGKINDLYALTGIDKSTYTKTNEEGMDALLKELDETESGFIMANLVDFDMLWGHRNDPAGFYEGLQKFDQWLPAFMNKLSGDDLLIITADHGNDPTTPSTDHSREYVPILVYSLGLKSDQNIGMRDTFADLQATLAEYFKVPSTGKGKSFLNLLN
ncbi:MAG: phosphopentomutase [Calditrichaceae bacterium]